MNEREIRDKFGFGFYERCQYHTRIMLQERGVKPSDVIERFAHEMECKALVEDLVEILVKEFTVVTKGRET